ncbi:ABC transporter substrate-binding protein [Microvirga alba]|uniref:ABC transporter substrate-binding protein n=1 Tax=Microvirga alba TaxID=2791025 RepID=A0A931FR13_9HYPH|nr:ABC transporter substrate-binding protein [Microvirga alba]MBF9235252.1 ABC transporter substrate-binding protein [Microvirga alba]
MKSALRHSRTWLAASALCLAFAAPALAQKADPKFNAWMQKNQFGPYQKDEKWEDVVANAKKEGEVVVYSSTGTMNKVAEDFAKAYPEIKVKAYDLGSEKTIEKVVREQQASVFAADVVYTGGTEQMVFDLLPNNRIVNYVPSYLNDRIPKEHRDPLLTHVIEAYGVFYNSEANPQPPIKNIWELTEPQWKGRFSMKSPAGSLTTLMMLAAIVEHSDDMEKAYEKHAGKKLKLSPDIENAGYEFLHRLIANDIVISDNSSKIATAVGLRGQAKPPMAFSVIHYLTKNQSDNYANAIPWDLQPAALFAYPTYVAVAGQAPHPNAAKLYVAFLMGSKDLNEKSELKQPFRSGASADLLQGMAAFYQIGTFSPRTDVPPPPNSEMWPKARKLSASPEFVKDNIAKISDFWTAETSR